MLLEKLCISKSAVLNFAHIVSPKTHPWVCNHFKELKNKIQDLVYAYIKSILTLNSSDPNLCFDYDLSSISQYLQCFLVPPSLQRLAVQSPHSGKVQTSSGFKVRAVDCTVLPQEFWSLSAADCELVSVEARCREAESPQLPVGSVPSWSNRARALFIDVQCMFNMDPALLQLVSQNAEESWHQIPDSVSWF